LSIVHFSTVAGGDVANLSNASPSDLEFAPATAQAGIQFLLDGRLTYVGNGLTGSPVNQWARGWPITGIGNSFQVAITAITGTAPSSGAALNTWQTISTTRQWLLDNPGTVVETLSGTWTISIRALGTTTVLASAVYTVSATVTTI